MTAVKIVEPPVALDPSSASSGQRVKKEKYTLASLPFPRGAASTSYTREWRKSFKSTLIHWAATLNDPFGTNAVMEDIITDIWRKVFPSIANEVVGNSREAIIHLVSLFIQQQDCKWIQYREFRQATCSSTGVVSWGRRDFVLSFLHSTTRELRKRTHPKQQSFTWRTSVSFTRILMPLKKRCVSSQLTGIFSDVDIFTLIP
jgi:hypothetical protein